MAIDNLDANIKYISVDKDGVWAWNHEPVLEGNNIFYSDIGESAAKGVVSKELIKEYEIMEYEKDKPKLYSVEIIFSLKETKINKGKGWIKQI